MTEGSEQCAVVASLLKLKLQLQSKVWVAMSRNFEGWLGHGIVSRNGGHTERAMTSHWGGVCVCVGGGGQAG